MTAERAARIPGAEPPVIVCGESHYAPIVEQLAEIGQRPRAGVLEPFGRNTAPAAAAAAMSAGAEDLLLLLPADHLIADIDAFVEAVKVAADVASAGNLVTFGITPTGPETGFGYIERGPELNDFSGAYAVSRFVEKPDLATAEGYVAAGTYSWNSGMFLFRADHYLGELERFAPDMVSTTRDALEAATAVDGARVLSPEIFAECPSDSIDYAVMERTDRAAVVPLDAGWNDVGSWAALWEVGDKDPDGNVVIGNAYLEGVTNSYVRAEDRAVAVIGVDNAVVVDTGDAVLVVGRDAAQGVKKIVQRLEHEGSDLVERHRPRG
jgi:mannose-1-phosphate guanylyltransferase/mannose-6-phosphate isomerase